MSAYCALMRQQVATQTIDLGALAPHTRLRVRIAVAAIPQYKVAGAVGISDSHLSRILSGRKEADELLLARIDQAIDTLAAA